MITVSSPRFMTPSAFLVYFLVAAGIIGDLAHVSFSLISLEARKIILCSYCKDVVCFIK